jgi:GNAT superfamily N-acetyltransferase
MSMATPVIRPARSDEAPALTELALRSKASWGYSPRLMKSFEAELTLTGVDVEDVLVIEVDGEPGGIYSLRPVSRIRAELGHLFVEPRLQRRGLGHLMIADALRRAGARGFRVLEIQGDPNAAPFYEQVGATRVGERESESVPGRMLPLFELAVPNSVESSIRPRRSGQASGGLP